MKQNTPAVSGKPETTAPNADNWDRHRNSFLKLIAEEARLQIIAGGLVLEEDVLENALVRLECARLVYNDSRDILAGALSSSVEDFEAAPDLCGVRSRSVARVADLLSDCRGEGTGASAKDKRTAERIVSAANARFREQQGL